MACLLEIAVTWLLLVASVTDSLRLASLNVPSTIDLGSPVWLNCTLDKENDELYSVKWYKNEEEFYRYLPRDKPALQKYEVQGIYLDVQKSIEGHVLLRRTDQYTEGTFRCEASAESPSFQTVTEEKPMAVYALSTEEPLIKGGLAKYEPGDLINVTCQSGKSRPPATLNWKINNQEVPPHYQINYPTTNDTEGLSISTLGLSFKADSKDFGGDSSLTLTCIAVVSHVYAMSTEQLILGDTESPIPATSQHEPMASPSFKSSDDSPMITNSRSKYRVGDMVDVNCSSNISKPPPQLNWFINEVEAQKRDTNLYGLRNEVQVLGLKFLVRPEHFDSKGELRLKCTATVSKIINTKSNEKVLGAHQKTSGLHASESVERVRNQSEQNHRWSLWRLLLGLLLTCFM